LSRIPGGDFSFSYSARRQYLEVPRSLTEELYMPSDKFDAAVDSVIAPARNCFSITPGDNGVPPIQPKAIYVGHRADMVARELFWQR